MVVCFAQRTKVANFTWITTAMGYRRRTTVVGFKEGTIGKQLQCLENSCRLCTENDSSEHKMENNSGGVEIENFSETTVLGYRRRQTVVGFK